ncbi:ATP-binding protein [Mechercharimyces sp. CAU 1602]|uniref:ATP-binding protein n=1 Tax=Mechercharimyces sp. CAU 1602 TaxID=2973933 RepID=UPI002162B310|nr:ATP-binding protein [Mechercharimyces sp. CAU 1602]MCS1351226.1 ATP-binding protein [Mechercharimyces sp. CAU 1602]
MDRREREERLRQQLAEAKQEWVRRDAKRETLAGMLADIEQEIKEKQVQLDLYESVRLLLQESSDYARKQAKEQIETLVTNALQFIFGSAFRFEIELTEHSGKPWAEFYVVTEWEGQEIRNKPQDARGGGIVDITSLALRIAMVETFDPRPQGPIILDEPGKHVSSEYVMNMLEFLQSTGRMFDRQMILVTHNPHLTEAADQVFHVQIKGGKTQIIPSSILDSNHEKIIKS